MKSVSKYIIFYAHHVLYIFMEFKLISSTVLYFPVGELLKNINNSGWFLSLHQLFKALDYNYVYTKQIINHKSLHSINMQIWFYLLT